MISWAYWYATPIMVAPRGTSSVCWTCDFAQHFRKLYGDCPLSGSWLCCGRSWTQRGLSSQGGEVGVTSTAGWKDGCYGHANHVVMQFVWNCILAQEGVIRVIWRQFDDYENHEAVANLAMFMPAMLFMKFLWKCNSAKEGVIRRYFEDNSIIMEIMKKREVVVITLYAICLTFAYPALFYDSVLEVLSHFHCQATLSGSI